MIFDTQIEEHIQYIKLMALVGVLLIILINTIINISNRKEESKCAKVSRVKLVSNIILLLLVGTLTTIITLTYEYLDLDTITLVVVLNVLYVIYISFLVNKYFKYSVEVLEDSIEIKSGGGIKTIPKERILRVDKTGAYYVLRYDNKESEVISRNLKGIDFEINKLKDDSKIRFNF